MPDRPVRLAELTTIGLGGLAPALHTAGSAREVAEILGGLDRVLVLGGGSNLVICDEGVEVPVVKIAIPGVTVHDASRAGALSGPSRDFEAIARIGAGEDWDGVVAQLVADGWAGVETLSGIPGSAGATPVQNVGAYGTEISDRLVDVEVYDRVSRQIVRIPPEELRLGYRSSVLRGTERAVVTQVRIGLSRQPAPVRYPELARTLGIEVGEPAPAPAVREAVLQLRRGKGMVLDPADPDTRSVGSFFTNPIVDAEHLASVRAAVAARLGPAARMPEYPVGGYGHRPLVAHHRDATGEDSVPGRNEGSISIPDRVKLSAAWLIERAGFGRGYPHRPGARIAISTKHSLALTNRGGGSAEELVDLAREIQGGVSAAFGVILEPEPILVGLTL